MIHWIDLTDEKQLDEIVSLSNERPVAIFKHSTSCSVSRMVKKGLEFEWKLSDAQMPIYYLDLLQYRSISNLIAERFGITHQSPQLIVLQNGKPVYTASHSDISYDELELIKA